MLNYYEILGVPPNASQAEIKAAYKKLAVRYHPDKNQGCALSEEIFKQINAAYQTLSDTTRRAHYDAILTYQAFYQSYTSNGSYTYTYQEKPSHQSGVETATTINDTQYALQWILGFIFLVTILVIGYYLIRGWIIHQRQEFAYYAKEEILRQVKFYEAEKEFQKAILYLDSLLKITAGYEEVFTYRRQILEKALLEAERLFQEGNYQQAVILLESINTSEQGKYDLYLQIALCYEKLEEYELALKTYQTTILRYGQLLEPYYRKALLLSELSRDQEALLVCDSAVKILVEEYKSRYGEAYPVLIEPNMFSEIHLKIFCVRARVFHRLNNLRRALNDCDWAAQLFPNRYEPYLLKGKILYENQQSGFCLYWQKAERLGSSQASKLKKEFCK
ncbi:MAG: DnaJ domain-containing protein [Cytophagales bacterium]|nr:DnaJ domain-containing protein [Cytophagales bacterium]MDW8384372.1 DnaJ domain-containing protein [Flammeovirgaceae bacterium]